MDYFKNFSSYRISSMRGFSNFLRQIDEMFGTELITLGKPGTCGHPPGVVKWNYKDVSLTCI